MMHSRVPGPTSTQGVSNGSDAIWRLMAGRRSRTAMPVGPRPSGLSCQLTATWSR